MTPKKWHSRAKFAEKCLMTGANRRFWPERAVPAGLVIARLPAPRHHLNNPNGICSTQPSVAGLSQQARHGYPGLNDLIPLGLFIEPASPIIPFSGTRHALIAATDSRF
jgi:hypothetical protein